MNANDLLYSPVTWTATDTQTHATTTATKAADTNRRHMVAGVTISFAGAVAATITVQLKDGSNVLDQWEIPASTPQPLTITYDRPLRGSVNSAITLVIPDAGAGIKTTAVVKGFSLWG